MEIRVRETGAVMFEGEFRSYVKANGGPSWDVTTAEILEALGADVVLEGAQANGGTVYQYSMRQGVEQVDGKWYTKYVLGPVFTDTVNDGVTTTAAQHEATYKSYKDDLQAIAVRRERDSKLAATDWRVVKAFESGQPLDSTWAAYRQALRDTTAQAGFPWKIDWPKAP